MNLETSYLGLKLRTPLMVGASPVSENIGVAREAQAAGAGALVMASLFEEQIDAEQRALVHHLEMSAESHSEAVSYFPNFAEFQLRPELYLRQIEALRRALEIPVIASLNGRSLGRWTEYAIAMEAAGAAALELNLYHLAADPKRDGRQVEADLIDTVRQVARAVEIPVAVKLSPFHASPVQFALALEQAGAAGIVLFNRFYQPDFEIDELVVRPQLRLSDSSELLLRLRWLALISPHLRGSLAATGGVHTSRDAIKALLAGAHAVQVVSAVMREGPEVLARILAGIQEWMTGHAYEGIDQFRGALNLQRCEDPTALERANYLRVLQSWRV